MAKHDWNKTLDLMDKDETRYDEASGNEQDPLPFDWSKYEEEDEALDAFAKEYPEFDNSQVGGFTAVDATKFE